MSLPRPTAPENVYEALAHALDELDGGGGPAHVIGAAGEPAFQNSWANNDGGGTRQARFYRDPFGIVHIEGFIIGGLANTTAFTLPDGFRTTAGSTLQFAVPTAAGIAGFVNVQTGGAVVPLQASATFLFGIHYRSI